MTNSNHTVEETVALKPCPFCGGEAERFTIHDEEPNNAGGDVITCKRCGASSHVEFGRKENLVSRWNTRLASHSTPAGEDVERTPSARWRENGEPDPHGNSYDCERAKLCGGHLTDDEVAYQTAMLMRHDLNHEAVLLTAKDRIRWLSRALEKAARAETPSTHDELVEALKDLSATAYDYAGNYLLDERDDPELSAMFPNQHERIVALFNAIERADAALTKMGEKL